MLLKIKTKHVSIKFFLKKEEEEKQALSGETIGFQDNMWALEVRLVSLGGGEKILNWYSEVGG